MPKISATTSSLVDALARLDKDIDGARRDAVEAHIIAEKADDRVAELLEMRSSIEPFIEQYVSPAGIPSDEAFGSPTASRTSLTDRVVEVFVSDPDAVLEVNDVVQRLKEAGFDAKPNGVRNAIYYAARSKKLHQRGRARFALKDASTPVATGVEVNGERSPSEIEGLL